MKIKIEEIKIEDITTDAGTQSRLKIDHKLVDDYTECMHEGDKFPPVVLFHDGSNYYLADGFHRLKAAMAVGKVNIASDVRSGNRDDALWFSIGANRTNGKRVGHGDKKNAITLAITNFPDKSQQEIANQVGCSQQYVAMVKGDNTSTCNIPETRKDAIGRNRPTAYKKADKEEVEDENTTEDGMNEKPNEIEEISGNPTSLTEECSDGLAYCEKAIAEMQKIDREDMHRAEAWARMRKWLDENE